jgi:hypothetical protein
MKHCFHIIAIALLALTAACSSKNDLPIIIDDAEQLAAAGNFDDAIDICNRLVSTADSANLSASQLCRIAVIYAVAADNDIDNDANMARAMRSFSSAYAISPDSVSAFVDHLTLERLSAVRTVIQLLHYQNDDPTNIDDIEDYAAAQFPDDTELDSIYNHAQ